MYSLLQVQWATYIDLLLIYWVAPNTDSVSNLLCFIRLPPHTLCMGEIILQIISEVRKTSGFARLDVG